MGENKCGSTGDPGGDLAGQAKHERLGKTPPDIHAGRPTAEFEGSLPSALREHRRRHWLAETAVFGGFPHVGVGAEGVFEFVGGGSEGVEDADV